MKFLFRTDASSRIGSGHVVRCNSLAQALIKRKHHVKFICKSLSGNLISYLEKQGVSVFVLPLEIDDNEEDAQLTNKIIQAEKPDWLVVDHYQINEEWERNSRETSAIKIMVIDDLANRTHDANLLLDQNLIENYQSRYNGLLPSNCEKLLGPQFALLRSEFLQLRQASLERRAKFDLKNVLVFMGGGDVFEETKTVIEALLNCNLKLETINVVVGQGCTNQNVLKQMVSKKRHAALHIQTNNMAELMKQADVAITGGGSVSWEKCTMGLPSLVTVMSYDQKPIAKALHNVGAQIYLGDSEQVGIQDYTAAIESLNSEILSDISQSAAQQCDGLGVKRIVKILENQLQYTSAS